MDSLRIGLDFDNTLVIYDELFVEIAGERGLLAPGSAGDKRVVRDLVRALPDGELEWQRLQAEAYGPSILKAQPAPGLRRFIELCRARGAGLTIVSHKTEFAASAPGGANLRHAARAWLRHHAVIGADSIPESNVFFESTRAEKIARIAALGCTHFIDDLEEVFDDPTFPAGVERLLIAADAAVPGRGYRVFASFDQIADDIFSS